MHNKNYFSTSLERDELNSYFGGGLPKNSLILIEGEDGSGKSILCQRLAYSMLKHGNKVTYISTELNTLGFINQLESVKYSIKNHMLNNDLLFLTMVPYMGNVKFEEDFLEKIMSSKKLFENEIIIFDTLSFLLVKKGADEGIYYNITNFFKKLNNLNKTVIFTIDPTYLDEKFLNLLRSMVDIFFNLKITNIGSETIRNINIKRFKRPKGLYKTNIPFRIEPQEGLIIEIGSYS